MKCDKEKCDMNCICSSFKDGVSCSSEAVYTKDSDLPKENTTDIDDLISGELSGENSEKIFDSIKALKEYLANSEKDNDHETNSSETDQSSELGRPSFNFSKTKSNLNKNTFSRVSNNKDNDNKVNDNKDIVDVNHLQHLMKSFDKHDSEYFDKMELELSLNKLMLNKFSRNIESLRVKLLDKYKSQYRHLSEEDILKKFF